MRPEAGISGIRVAVLLDMLQTLLTRPECRTQPDDTLYDVYWRNVGEGVVCRFVFEQTEKVLVTPGVPHGEVFGEAVENALALDYKTEDVDAVITQDIRPAGEG